MKNESLFYRLLKWAGLIKTDLQKFKDLFNGIDVKYQVDIYGNVKVIAIDSRHLFHNCRGEVEHAIGIVFDKNDKLMYFEGTSCK